MDNKSIPLGELAKAIYTINRHAKTAPEPQHLYFIKKETIKRLLKEKQAIKVGLHFSDHPKFSNQHSTLLVKVDNYYFHIPPEKQDFKELEHLGKLDQDFRNPRTKMSLSQAKKVIYRYIDWKPKNESKSRPTRRKQYTSSYYTPSSLGKMERTPKKTYRHF
ncbi:YkyB family protein [Lentibacillus sp. Marseille-P4043]|uniref:YkyB family protein n=1 Tax=Lentibacillus sp. Marseille-P4043 TaxID=2040293 RepID=UPI000D0B7789|nr:YkyB family protein [Lentibacillus sp. Marseille-P4043]